MEATNEKVFCQSCGMPMESADMYATNADGTKTSDYCMYCYKDGAFLQDCTMDEMIEFCVPMTVENTTMTEEEARSMMQQFFPTLKRWKA